MVVVVSFGLFIVVDLGLWVALPLTPVLASMWSTSEGCRRVMSVGVARSHITVCDRLARDSLGIVAVSRSAYYLIFREHKLEKLSWAVLNGPIMVVGRNLTSFFNVLHGLSRELRDSKIGLIQPPSK